MTCGVILHLSVVKAWVGEIPRAPCHVIAVPHAALTLRTAMAATLLRLQNVFNRGIRYLRQLYICCGCLAGKHW